MIDAITASGSCQNRVIESRIAGTCHCPEGSFVPRTSSRGFAAPRSASRGSAAPRRPAASRTVWDSLPVSVVPTENLASFAELGLPRPVVTALSRNGITTPFPIQAATIPDVLAGR